MSGEAPTENRAAPAAPFEGVPAEAGNQPLAATPPAPVISVPELCLNCGATLAGEYCASCGQHKQHHVTSITHTAAELVEDLFHADARVWRTLRPLLFKPGFLTVEYLRGKRVSYTPPFRLYIILSLIFFLIPSQNQNNTNIVSPSALSQGPVQYELIPEARTAIDTAVARGRTQEERAALRKQLEQSFRTMTPEQQRASGPRLADPCSTEEVFGTAADSTFTQQLLRNACTTAMTDNGKPFMAAVTSHIPQMLFVLLPLLALIGKALYARSHRYYIEHLLFFVHFQAFFFLAFSISKAVSWPLGALDIGWLDLVVDLLGFALLLYVPVYLFLALRRVYAQGRAVTVAKTALIGVGYATGLLLAFAFLLVFTALTLR